jgi:hypothetical protein
VLPSLALSARQVAPSDATDSEIALIADDLADGYSAEEALGQLWQRRDSATDAARRARAFGVDSAGDLQANYVDNPHKPQWRTTE